MTVIERLSDGTLILSNGFKILPSYGKTADGSAKKLNEMSESEKEKWNARLMQSLGEHMSAIYAR